MRRFSLSQFLLTSSTISSNFRFCSNSSDNNNNKDTSNDLGKDVDDGPVITPWSVSLSSSEKSNSNANQSKTFDYSRVIDTFKSQKIEQEDIVKLRNVFEELINNNDNNSNNSENNSDIELQQNKQRREHFNDLERYFSRKIVFSHRDLHPFLSSLIQANNNKDSPSYLYTGRGPSSTSMHIGHLIPFLLCRSLQHTFQLPLVIQITDDEKYLFRNLQLAQLDTMSRENIRDIIATGLDPDRTFIFRNTSYFGEMYMNVLQIQRCFSTNSVQHTFGFTGSDCIGKVSFAATQAAPAFATTFPKVLPMFRKVMTSSSNNNNNNNSNSKLIEKIGNKTRCLIPCAIDQDPFFVLMRNNCCGPLKKPKPSLLHTTFLPGLKGPSSKMSSSDETSVILLSDNDAQVKKKMRSAFSGGRATLKELQEKGANLDADVAFQYLRYFLKDSQEFEEIGQNYGTGKMSTGAVKDRAAECVIEVLQEFRTRRAEVTDEVIEKFCEKRFLK